MTRHDEVFALFVEANPVSTLERDSAPVPDLEVTLSLLTTQAPMEPFVTAPSTMRRRRLAAAAAFVLVIAAVGLSITLFGGTTTAPPVTPSSTTVPSTTTVTPTTDDAAVTTTTTTADPLAAVAADAEAAALEFLGALGAGDVDAVMSMSVPRASNLSDRRVHEFIVAFAAAGMPSIVGDCIAEQVTDSSALVRCELSLGDLVARELGPETIVYPFRYEDGLLAWQPFEGIDIGEVNRAYADYLRTYLPDDYVAACSPSAYDPLTVVQSNLLALTGECGELAASVAEDVVTWIRGGRPEPAG